MSYVLIFSVDFQYIYVLRPSIQPQAQNHLINNFELRKLVKMEVFCDLALSGCNTNINFSLKIKGNLKKIHKFYEFFMKFMKSNITCCNVRFLETNTVL